MTIDITFIDAGRKATEKPNPKHPDGIDVNLAPHALVKVCGFNVPYPAPRVGAYSIKCRDCGFTALVTVAGRADDPRTVALPCRPN